MIGGGWLVIGTSLLLWGDPRVLEWDAPAGCPTRPEVEAQIQDLLGGSGPSVGLDATELRFTARVTPLPDARWRMTLETTDGSWRNVVEATDCAELGATAALLVASAIDPLAALGPEPGEEAEPSPGEPSPEEEPATTELELEPEPEPEPGPARPSPSVDEPPSERPGPKGPFWRGGLDLGAGAGVLPGPYAALSGHGAVGAPWLHGRVGLTVNLPTEARDGDVSAMLWSLHVDPGVCTRWAGSRVAVPGCLDLSAGFLAGSPSGGVANGASRVLPSVRTGLRAGLEIRLARGVWLTLTGAGRVGLVNPGFSVEGAGLLHRAGAFDGRALLGFSVIGPEPE